ncbi:MAG: polysaccharide deacetylase family protein [Candidatus Ratteibacteria bacterium]|nr:polysaccharide deacetylase family protein [Candidatus Ratteibacteria bacterium]
MILAYHRVNPYYKDDALSVSPESFERQVEYLLKKGFKPELSYKDTINHDKFLITFDDGYADNLWYAIPILKKFNIKPLIFLTVDYIGTDRIFSRYKDKEKDRFLNWEEVKTLSEEGILFGSHSLSHPHLLLLDDKRLWEEVSISKKIIEEKTGKDVPYFCYPYGDFDERIIDKVKEANYKAAFITPPRGKKVENTTFTLLRTGIYGHNNLLIFRIKIWKSLREKRY